MIYWPFSGTGSVDFIGNLSSDVCLYRVFISAVHCSKSLRPCLKWLWSNFSVTGNLLNCKWFEVEYFIVSGLPIWNHAWTVNNYTYYYNYYYYYWTTSRSDLTTDKWKRSFTIFKLVIKFNVDFSARYFNNDTFNVYWLHFETEIVFVLYNNITACRVCLRDIHILRVYRFILEWSLWYKKTITVWTCKLPSIWW